jgi:UDP-N-acetylglucosamine 2-epimerase (non-hydrolysing)
MFEVLSENAEKIDQSTVLENFKIEPNDYFVVSLHREENVEDVGNLSDLVDMLNGIAQRYEKRIIMSTHPRTRKRIDQSGTKIHELVELKKPLGFLDYCKLQKNAFIVLSDSGTVSEESSILNFPALNIREAHERPEAMEEGAVMMTGMTLERVFQGIEIAINQPRGQQRLIRLAADYSMPNVSDKVLRIIESYTDYVNRVVWRKF